MCGHEWSKKAGASADEVFSNFADPPLRFRPLQLTGDFTFHARGGYPPKDLVDLLVQRGLGGAVVNVGHEDYLASEKEWGVLRDGVRLMLDRGLTVWLYDEQGYPSGTAGGKVLEGHPEWEAEGLFCVARRVRGGEETEVSLPAVGIEWVRCLALRVNGSAIDPEGLAEVSFATQAPVRFRAREGTWLLLCFARRKLRKGTHADHTIYVHRPFVNLLTPEATEAFCEMTHEQYARRLGGDLAKVQAVFTDEPSLLSAYFPMKQDVAPDELGDPVEQALTSVTGQPKTGAYPANVPWEIRFPDWFREIKGYDVWRVLPALFFDFPGARQFRYDFYDVVSRKVAENYMGVIRRHCERIGIASSGHLMAEDWPELHVEYTGDLFRALRNFHIPGVDMYFGRPETVMSTQLFLIPKFAASVSHLISATGTMVEHSDWGERAGSAEGWPLSMDQRLSTLALLFAMGVDTITSCYAFHDAGDQFDLDGVGVKEPLGPEYRQWGDCAGRLALLLRGGCHVCDTAVYYPVEGVQACHKPAPGGTPPVWERRGDPVIRSMEDAWVDSCRFLVQGQRDFDLVDDQAFEEARFEGGRMKIAGESYQVLVLTSTPAIPLTALKGMARFVEAGGILLLVGSDPEGAAEPGAEQEFIRLWQRVCGGRVIRVSQPGELPGAISKVIEPDVRLTPAVPDVVAVHRRHDRRDTYLLVNTSAGKHDFHAAFAAGGKPHLFRPISGEIAPADPVAGGYRIALDGYACAAIVFCP